MKSGVRHAHLLEATSWQPPPYQQAAGDSWGLGRGRKRTLPGHRHDDPGTVGQHPDESKPEKKKHNYNFFFTFLNFIFFDILKHLFISLLRFVEILQKYITAVLCKTAIKLHVYIKGHSGD